MTTRTYYPEMGQPKPACTMEAIRAHRGWIIKTPSPLPRRRGVTHVRTYTAADLVPEAQSKVGWHEYRLTERAFEMMQGEVAVALLLD